MITDIGNQTIDLSKVERVGAVGGDPSWLRYNVYFTSGISIEIYEERRDGLQMKRDAFVKLWRDSSEFVDIFLKQRQSLPIDSVSNCSQECEWKADTFDNIGMALTEYCEECGEKRDC
jgi:hypothetical protein